jgi:hypothetical protein
VQGAGGAPVGGWIVVAPHAVLVASNEA